MGEEEKTNCFSSSGPTSGTRDGTKLCCQPLLHIHSFVVNAMQKCKLHKKVRKKWVQEHLIDEMGPLYVVLSFPKLNMISNSQ